MKKLSGAWLWLIGTLAAIGLTLLCWALGLGEWITKRMKAQASKQLAADLKAKVAGIQAQRAGEKVATAAQVAQVQADASAAKAADSVDVANALIADAKAGKQ